LPRETLPFAASGGALFGHVFTSAEPRMALPAMPAFLCLVAYAAYRRRRRPGGG
jgi:hypothetical protein